MAEFEMFYIFDSREMSNVNYIPKYDQWLPLEFNKLDYTFSYEINEYIVCEVENKSYFDLTTYVLFIPKVQDRPKINTKRIELAIAPKHYENFLSRIQCYKFCDITIDRYNYSGLIQKDFLEQMHDEIPIFKYTYPSYLHLNIKSMEFFGNSWINKAYYQSCIELLQNIISDDFVINEDYLSDRTNSYFFRASMKELPERQKITDIYLESNAYRKYLEIKGIENDTQSKEHSVEQTPLKEKKSTRKVFVFE